MVRVFENYSVTPDYTVETPEAFDALITVVCRRDNYGIYRRWEQDGMVYYDCGSKVFAAYKDELEKN